MDLQCRGAAQILNFNGAGIAINGGSASITNNSTLDFKNDSTAGSATITNGSSMNFYGTSSAGSATITNNNTLYFRENSDAGTAIIGGGGMEFVDQSSANGATITNDVGLVFRDTATAGSATITNNANLTFTETTTAGSATITTATGKTTTFNGNSTGGNAALIASGTGTFDFTATTGANDDGLISAGSIAGAGTFALGGNELTLGGNNASTTFSGVISSDLLSLATGISLIKVGTGKLILSGDSTYIGGTRVDGGTLQVDGTINAPSGIIVSNGGTLAGAGNVSVVAVNAGGTFAPGASAGRIDTGAVAFATGATLAIELGGSAIGQFDQLDVTGTVNLNSDSLGGATLSASLISAFDPSTIAATDFVIIENDGVDAVTGTFAGLAEGAEFVADKRLFTVSYIGGDGNDVELTSGGASIAGTAAADLIDGLYAPLGEHVATELRDVIDGAGGNDQISGLGGNDTLIGGLGKDRMTGGLGADVFDFNLKAESGKGSHRDVIKDFVHLTDHIDLHDIDAKSKTTLVNDDFKFIGTKAFHHKAGELHYFKQNVAGTAHDKTIIEGDTNGDGKADFQIELSHLTKLGAGDFVL